MRDNIIIALLVVMICILTFSIVKGCSCTRERFSNPDMASDKHDDAKPSGDFTKAEMELFEDIKNNRLQEKDVEHLIDKGILTEGLVQKMLDRIDHFENSENSAPTSATVVTKPPMKKVEKVETVDSLEPFCGDAAYAAAV